MTTDVALLSKIYTLAPELKVEAMKYVDFLLYAKKKQVKPLQSRQKRPKQVSDVYKM